MLQLRDAKARSRAVAVGMGERNVVAKGETDVNEDLSAFR